MPIRLPPKARVRAVPARRQAAVHSIDWLGLWALSLSFCAIVLAGIAYFMNGDNIGASFILVGTAAIIAVIVRFGTDRDEARRKLMQAVPPTQAHPRNVDPTDRA